ncbi:UNVERIFIED_CONTAM: hypothetical protein FKN15_065944 [Acipenser sinensis]
MQLRCYEMERRLKTPDLFKFPYFEAICWYVAKNLLETLKELREDSCQPPYFLLEGVKALTTALKSWLKREVTELATEVPDHIRPGNLIKELSKEIRYQEAYIANAVSQALTKQHKSLEAVISKAMNGAMEGVKVLLQETRESLRTDMDFQMTVVRGLIAKLDGLQSETRVMKRDIGHCTSEIDKLYLKIADFDNRSRTEPGRR